VLEVGKLSTKVENFPAKFPAIHVSVLTLNIQIQKLVFKFDSIQKPINVVHQYPAHTSTPRTFPTRHHYHDQIHNHKRSN
jgi:hypothetical protein